MTANTMGNRVSVPIPMLTRPLVPTESQTNASTTAAA